MPIDPNIPLQNRPHTQLMQPLEVMGQAMTMKRLALANQAQEQEQAQGRAMSDLYKKNVVTDEAGNKSINEQGVLSGMIDVAPEKHAELQKRFATQKLEQLKAQTEQQSHIAQSIFDEPTYYQARQKALQMGLHGAENLPETYPGAQYIEKMRMTTLSNKEQIDAQLKKLAIEASSMDRKDRRSIDREKLNLEREKAKNKGKSGESLPIDVKKTVEGIASKNANLTSIQSELNTFLNQWDNMKDENQKLKAGQALLKTLNSTQGSDAVGAEESKRLGSMLEYALGNFTNENPTQFGRDLKGFRDQVAVNRDKLKGTLNSNQTEIDRLMGRPVKPAQQEKKSAETAVNYDDLSDDDLTKAFLEASGGE